MGVTGIAMSEEEKKAIEKIKKKMDFRKNVMKDYEKDNCLTGFYYELKEEVATYETILNLIEKQQKELNNLKEIEKSHQEENGKLRVELEQEKEKNKELEEKLKIAKQLYNDACVCIATDCVEKDKIKAIVDEHIPKQPNIITGEIEYTPNANANSFLVQDILELLEGK